MTSDGRDGSGRTGTGPTEADLAANEQTAIDDGDAPDDGETSDNGGVPDDGETSDNRDAPDDGETSDNGGVPDDGETSNNGDAPDDGEDLEDADAFVEADVDWELAPESNATFEPDETRCSFLREVAADVRRNSSESKQLSAIIYRVSDLYDPDEDTSPEEIYLNVRHIMRIKEQGGIRR